MTDNILFTLGYVEAALTVLALVCLIRSKSLRSYWAFAGFLLVHASSVLFLTLWAVYFQRGLSPSLAYRIYFFSYYGSFAIEAVFSVLTVYTIYKAAMEPLEGLQSLGMLVFKWVAAISTAITLGITLGPRTITTVHFVESCATTMQRGAGILTLSLLLFVCFAIRPMGLSYRSRIFGVNLGLGVISTLNMIQSAWTLKNPNLIAAWQFIGTVTIFATLGVWIWYFAVPEPKRRYILLPTTSPFLRWNQISELLGHNPGYVALGGFTPDTFAPAELEVLKRASKKINTPLEVPISSQAA